LAAKNDTSTVGVTVHRRGDANTASTQMSDNTYATDGMRMRVRFSHRPIDSQHILNFDELLSKCDVA
jgi:hypothetical protein